MTRWPLVLILLLAPVALALIGGANAVGGAFDVGRNPEFIVLSAGFVLFVAAMRGQVRRG